MIYAIKYLHAHLPTFHTIFPIVFLQINALLKLGTSTSMSITTILEFGSFVKVNLLGASNTFFGSSLDQHRTPQPTKHAPFNV